METAQDLQLWNVSEILLTYCSNVPAEQRPIIKTSADTFQIFRHSWDSSTIELFESFKILLTNRSIEVLGTVEIGRGGIDACYVDLRLIFAAALQARASGIILAHNHPSGQMTPSKADRDLTSRAVEVGKLLGITVLDHVIISGQKYFSFCDEGIL